MEPVFRALEITAKALVAATGDLPVDAVAEVVADRDAMLRGAKQHTLVEEF